MSKKNKENFDAASLNKEDFIQKNYLIKEDDNTTKSITKKQTVIAVMLFIFFACLVFILYQSFFNTPETHPVSEQLQATAVASATPSPELTAFPVTPAPKTILSKYDEYFDIYPDIVGWISIENIKVNYPVVQSPDPRDPSKYLTKGPDEEDSKYGAIYLDVRNSIDASDRHTIIYGHNMKDGAMFGQLDLYLKKTFYDTHLIIRYDTLYQELEWEVFNVFKTTTDFYYIEAYFTSDQEFIDLMNQCVYQNYYGDYSTVIAPEDRILTLSTCTDGNNKNERLVLQARLITPLNEISVQESLSAP